MDPASAVLAGLRAPSSEIAGMASHYLSEVIKPHGTHHKPQILGSAAERAPPSTGGGAMPASAIRQDGSVALREALTQTRAAFEATAPVHVHDLKEVADAKTRELLEREREVRGGSFALSMRPPLCFIRYRAMFLFAAVTHASIRFCLGLQVLRYSVYMTEAVPNNPPEPLRVRVFQLSFHTVDGTVRLYEPLLTNSGLLQVRAAVLRVLSTIHYHCQAYKCH